MITKPSARAVVALSTRLGRLARRHESKHLRKGLVDLADLYAAARHYCSEIEKLTRRASVSKRRTAGVLARLQVVLYDEIMDHLVHLRSPLDRSIDELFNDSKPRTGKHK